MGFSIMDVETLSPQRRPKVSDLITGVGIKTRDKEWIRIIKPSGGRHTDNDEAHLILDTIEELYRTKTDILAGCYLWSFDLPSLIARTDELSWHFSRDTGRELQLELGQVLGRFRIIDLATCDWVIKELFPKYGKYLSVDELCKELTDEEPLEFPKDFHVWASAKALSGEPKHLVKRLENDLRIEWAILQALLRKECLPI